MTRLVRLGYLAFVGLLLGSGAGAAESVIEKEFTVDARTNATKAPLATGLHVVRGDVVTFHPNKDDRWHHGKAGLLDYRGGPWGNPHGRHGVYMVLHLKIGRLDRAVTDGLDVTVPADGDLLLYCSDTPKDNGGTVR